MKLRVVTAW